MVIPQKPATSSKQIHEVDCQHFIHMLLLQAAGMDKPVPSDEVSDQPVEGSHKELKEQEVQEDQQAQQMAKQAARQTPEATLPANN